MGALKDAMQAIYTAEFGVSTFSALTKREHIQLQSLFSRTLSRADGSNTFPKSIVNDWRALGFTLQQIHSDATWVTYSLVDFWRRGQGMYFFRTKSAPYFDLSAGRTDRTLLVTPHSDTDLYTDVIGRQMFENTGCRFLACNSVTRYSSDMSRDPDHAVTPLVQAIKNTRARWVEVHGFTENPTRTSSRPGAGAPVLNSIITNGTTSYLDPVLGVYTDLLTDQKADFPDYVIEIYGQYADDLGAETNLNNQALQVGGCCKFLHIEHGDAVVAGTGKGLRTYLRDNQSLCESEYGNFKFRDI